MVTSISQEKKDKLIQKEVNQKEKLLIKIYGKKEYEKLLKFAYLVSKDKNYKFARTNLIFDIFLSFNNIYKNKFNEYHIKICNVNSIYSYIYLSLKKNKYLDKKDEIMKTNLAVYIAELFYRFFYDKPMIDGHYIANLANPYINIEPLTVDIKNINELKSYASMLSKEKQESISVCLKTKIMAKSASELFNEFVNHDKLVGYRKTIEENTTNPTPIFSFRINNDSKTLRELCEELL